MLSLAALAACVGAAVAAPNGPVVFWASDPVGPGEAVMVAGGGLAPAQAVEVARLSDWWAGRRAQDEVAFPRRCTTVAAVQPSDGSVKFALPARMGRGVYVARVVTASARSAPFILNRPTVMWVQGDAGTTASPGGSVQTFGRCLAMAGGRTRLRLTGPLAWTLPRRVSLTAASDGYAAQASLPRGIPPGDYQVRVHNGYGGRHGWSAPARITVAERAPWPGKVFDVAAFGATGRGDADDTLAVRAALAAAGKAGGGVVHFPRGRYRLSDALAIPRFVVLKGEARELAMIFWPDTEAPPKALIHGTNSFGIEDLTIQCGNHGHVIAGDLGDQPEAGDVFLRRVLVRAVMYRRHITQEQAADRLKTALRFSSGGGDTVRLGGRNIEITDCDLYGSGRVLFLSKARNGLVARNRLYNGRWGWYCISGSDGLVVEGNTLQGADLMSTGGGLNCLDGSPCSQNIYFAHNTLRLFHGWDGEAMTSDAGGGAYFGGVASCEGSTVVLAEEPKWGGRDWTGAAVFVLGGKGAGQYRRIASKDGRKIELDAALAVPLDATSRVSVTMLQRHCLIVGNRYEDATVSAQFYGISIAHVIAGNTCARAGGFHNFGKWYHGYQPSWFCQLLGNRIVEGTNYRGPLNQFPPIDSHIAAMGYGRAPCTDPLNRFTVIRGNELLNNARVELKGQVADAIIEGNRIENADAGVHVDGGCTGAWLRGNAFRRVRSPYSGPGLKTSRVHAAELMLGRLAGAREVIREQAGGGMAPDWSGLEARLAALRRLEHDDARVADGCAACYAPALASLRALASSGAASQHWLRHAAESLLGLSVAVSPQSTAHSVLQTGEGGAAEVALDLALAADVPPLSVVARLGDARARAELTPGGRVRMAIPYAVAKGAWGIRTLAVRLDVSPAGAEPLSYAAPVPVGGAFLRQWSAIGPFPNVDQTPLDNAMHPPEEQLTLEGEYDGLGGKVRWRPVALAKDWLDFAAAFGRAENAVAFAAACVVAKEATTASLGLDYAEGIRVWVNGAEAFAGAAPEGTLGRKDLPVELRAGENTLLVMASHLKGQWQVRAELRETGAGGLLSTVAAGALASRAALSAPPRKAPKPTAAGALAFPEGIEWQLVFEDTFERKAVGPLWKPIRGTWKIAAGTLATDDVGLIGTAKRLRAPVRIEYDARSDSPSDLTALWVRHGESYAGGYFIGFGSNGNTLNKLLKDGETVATSPRPLIAPRTWHHVIAQVLPRGVMLVVDDTVALNYRDPHPPRGADTAGLCAWGAGRFDNVRIYTAK